MRVPIQLQHKRLVCKTAEKHFDSAEVVIFHLSAFHYLGQPMKILKGRQWEGGPVKIREVLVWRVLIASHFLANWVKMLCRWRKVMRTKINK